MNFYWIMTLQSQQDEFGRIEYFQRSGTSHVVNPEERAESIFSECVKSTGNKKCVIMFYHVEPISTAGDC